MKNSDLNTVTGYLGTYSSPDSEGIYRFALDKASGILTGPDLFCKLPDCKYLSLSSNQLAAPVRTQEAAGITLLDIGGDEPSLIDDLYEEEQTACFVTQDEDFIYTANYHQGLVLIYKKTDTGLTLHKKIEIAPGAGCHQVLLHEHYILVPCLLKDEIRIFDRDRDYCPAGSIFFQPGTGPRHGIFTKDHRYLFVVSELSNELYVYRLENTANPAELSPDSGSEEGIRMTMLSVTPLLSREQTGNSPAAPASAAIRFSPDERHLYVSTRFTEIISVFRVHEGQVTLVQQLGSGGTHPRDIVITEDGTFLLAANRTKGGLVCFPVDPDNGMIGPECSRIPAPEAVSIVLDETN